MNDVIEWNATKNLELKQRYGFGFEQVLVALSEGYLLDERQHQNLERYGHQRQLIVQINGYVWVVPYVIAGDIKFFKMLFPSRVETKRYLGK
jgi:hypothetical protein